MKKYIIFPVLLCVVAVCAFIFGKSLANHDKEIPSVTTNIPIETTTVPITSYAEEYSPNTIKMIINGKVYYGNCNTVSSHVGSSISPSTYLNFNFPNNENFSAVSFRMPEIKLGYKFYASLNSNQDNIEFDLYDNKGNSMGYLQTAKSYGGYSSFQNSSLLNGQGSSNNGLTTYSQEEKNRFSGKDDYFQIEIISNNSQGNYAEIKFRFNGRFEAGQIVISGTGYMKKYIDTFNIVSW